MVKYKKCGSAGLPLIKGGVGSIKKLVPYIKIFFERADIFLLAMCTISSIYGVFMVRRAVNAMAGSVFLSNPTKYVIVQVFSVFIGIAFFVAMTVIDSDLLGEQWRALCIINVGLIIALVIFGADDGTGNKAWIRFAGIGVQPSEVIKILYIIVSAKQMTYLKEYKDINSLFSVAQMAGHFALVFGMIVVVSADLGSASILLFVFLVMFFCLGVKLYWFALGGAAVAAVIPVLWTYFLKDYQKKRLLSPYDPSIDPDGWGISWQTTQSKLTLASGRMTGVDAEHTRTVFTGKHTDFIFSTTGETLGMIGCIVIIILLIIIILHIAKIGLSCGRTYDMLICMGIAGAMASQMFINIGMCIGITPVIGITLPFFSYGGSSMVTMYAAAGIVSGVKFKLKPQHSVLA